MGDRPSPVASAPQRRRGGAGAAPGAAGRVRCTLGRCAARPALWSPVKPFTRVH
ncbi:MAG: hypothetical protein AVDCRST_MAG20-1501 [uncultured Acidimicrobiales bacterium]|uniref:Uncharacterized protein n=1 Tax=uncultured Acidimicrobiales bacterium TaxID=310071 RepID=A0A6J4HYJ2_9ACTN|nr:MAG: hypothetical protein AVDCRST_MAG20-1501 [uncultured Acidimicrobiales bacterium]